MKSVFDTVVCINGKLQDECLERRDLGNLTFLVIQRNRGIPADLSCEQSRQGFFTPYGGSE